MANIDAPIGFWPVRHLTGGEIRANVYTVTHDAVCYQGEILKVVAGGTVEPAAADAGIIALGVAAEYKDGATAGTKILVYDDPNIVFGVQSDSDATGIVAIDVFASSDHVKTHTGNTTTLLSGDELVATPAGAQFIILGLCNTRDANNTWGPNADVEVIFGEHLFKAALVGV